MKKYYITGMLLIAIGVICSIALYAERYYKTEQLRKASAPISTPVPTPVKVAINPEIAKTPRLIFLEKIEQISIKDMTNKFNEELSRNFKDLDSLKFKGLSYYPRMNKDGKLTHYWCGVVNGKNSYGAYVGYEAFVLIMNDGVPTKLLLNGNGIFEDNDLIYVAINENCHEQTFN